MSYQVLSLKWRPQTFEDVVGQEHVTHTLINAFKQDRVGQGYMFTGPRGVGKTTSARIFAKVLNCPEVKAAQSCNICTVCEEITDGRNMDVLEVDGASNRGIEEIRNFRELIKYPPVNAPYKVFIIDEVHMLTKPAFNALLRTLEEPPSHGKFVLCTTDIHKVPSTIISRCQRFDFHRISISVISDRLEKISKAESISVDQESLTEIARKADGSMRDALSILDQVIAFSGDSITFTEVAKVLGLVSHELFFRFTHCIRNKKGKQLIELLRELRSQGVPLEEITRGLNLHIRNLLYAGVEDGIESLELNPDLQKDYKEEVQHWNTRDLLRIGNIMNELSHVVRRSDQPQILLEMTALKLLEMDKTESIEELIRNGPKKSGPKPYAEMEEKQVGKHIDDPQKKLFSGSNKSAEIINSEPGAEPKISESKPSLEKTVPANGVTLNQMNECWPAVLENLSSKRPSLGTILEESKPVSIHGNKLIINVSSTSKFTFNSLEKNRAAVEEVVQSVTGQTMRVLYSSGDDLDINQSPESPPENKNLDEPVLQRMIERFDGEILR